MTISKAQERKALEQIKNIVLGLGADSYIGTAFEGCFEIAESNIDNDFACSMKERAEQAEHELKCMQKKCEDQKTEISRLEIWINEWSEKYGKLKDERDKLQKELDEANEEITDLDARLAIAENELDEADEFKGTKVAELEQEIIKLKAKLYDLMVKEGE